MFSVPVLIPRIPASIISHNSWNIHLYVLFFKGVVFSYNWFTIGSHMKWSLLFLQFVHTWCSYNRFTHEMKAAVLTICSHMMFLQLVHTWNDFQMLNNCKNSRLFFHVWTNCKNIMCEQIVRTASFISCVNQM
jgi:hypothetical protein